MVFTAPYLTLSNLAYTRFYGGPFSILLDNAVKYCDPEGTIRLSLSQHGRNICISVSNPCKGIDTHQLSRYFDRFYRVDSSRSRSTAGYGIGLSTAKAIVIRHHGHIANSYADGIITFTAKIPKTCWTAHFGQVVNSLWKLSCIIGNKQGYRNIVFDIPVSLLGLGP